MRIELAPHAWKARRAGAQCRAGERTAGGSGCSPPAEPAASIKEQWLRAGQSERATAGAAALIDGARAARGRRPSKTLCCHSSAALCSSLPTPWARWECRGALERGPGDCVRAPQLGLLAKPRACCHTRAPQQAGCRPSSKPTRWGALQTRRERKAGGPRAPEASGALTHAQPASLSRAGREQAAAPASELPRRSPLTPPLLPAALPHRSRRRAPPAASRSPSTARPCSAGAGRVARTGLHAGMAC